MGEREDGNVLDRLCGAIASGEERILARVLSSVAEEGLARTPRAETAWRDSVRGISDMVLQAVYGVPYGYAEGGVGTDPVRAFGMVRGRLQWERGVSAGDWRTLLRHHRDAYLELVASAGYDEADEEVCRDFLAGVFDRFERGFFAGYAEAGRKSADGRHVHAEA